MRGRSERVSSTAIRVEQAEASKLFIHEGSRQSLERRLRAAFAGPVVLGITDNRHSIVSHHVQSKVLYARVHHMFLDAPPDVMDALAQYVTSGSREAGYLVDVHIQQSGARLGRRAQRHLHTKGATHDLTAIYDAVNERYFNGSMQVQITWGRKGHRKKKGARKTIRMGSYSQLERLITINPLLDQSWVPRYFVAFVVYHEMLHHLFPSDADEVRRCLHPPEFLEREKQYTWYERAVAWETKNIDRLLRS